GPIFDLAIRFNNLGELLRAEKRYDEAEESYREALKIYTAEIGRSHPSTAHVLGNIALLYKNTARMHEAEALFRETLAIMSKFYGNEDMRTARARDFLGSFL